MVHISPRISIEEHTDGEVVQKGQIEIGPEPPSIDEGESFVEGAESHDHQYSEAELASVHVQMPNLPPLPPPPMKPGPLSMTIYSDPGAQAVIRKDHERQMKAYEQAMQDREAAQQDRKDLEHSLRVLALQEKGIQPSSNHQAKGKNKNNTEKTATESTQSDATPTLRSTGPSDAQTSSIDHQALPSASSRSAQPSDLASPTEAASMFSIDREESRSIAPESRKRKKDRKFCALPKKINGERDPLWVRVYMENHDEVSAHTGLFYMNETYERLVGDVGAKIEEWVRDEMTRRMIEEFAE